VPPGFYGILTQRQQHGNCFFEVLCFLCFPLREALPLVFQIRDLR
jgi:hypothetical protein